MNGRPTIGVRGGVFEQLQRRQAECIRLEVLPLDVSDGPGNRASSGPVVERDQGRDGR
jgi:hypothetical protein